MKRIISIFLCVAMLMSMLAMSVSAYGELADRVTTENVMTFETDKESYKPGEDVTITVAMESIWGDPTLEGDIYGYDGQVMSGAYGMGNLTATLIYDPNVFTAKAYTSLLDSSTILNADATDAVISASNPIDARATGSQNVQIESDIYNADYTAYGFFSGSGTFAKYNLTIAADADPGTYYLPVGPYRMAQGNSTPEIVFADYPDRGWITTGNFDAFFIERDVEYKTGYTGGSRVTSGAEYECSYVKIVIKGDENPEDIAAAEAVDALIDAIGTVQNSGDAILVDTINNGAPYTHIADVPETDTFTVSFKMMPIAGGETFGYFGGTTDADGGSHNIFWNAAEKKFQIAEVNNWVAPSSVESVLAESEVMDLPANRWTEVEYIYNGSNLAVKVNGEIVCSTDSADTGYAFYIMYPSQAALYVKDMVVTGDFGVVECAPYFTADAFSTVTLDSGAAIAAAEEAYAGLNDNAKSFVTKAAVLDDAIAEYAAIADYNNQVAADKAIELIDAIGTVIYPTSGDAIVAAEEYVATLNETQLALVTNYATLTAARETYNTQKGLFDQAKADYVIGLIDAIGTVTFESREAIETAEEEYAKLTADQQALVSNYQILVDAREAFNLYGPIMNAENLINAIGTEFYQGTVIHQNCSSSSGYANLPDKDGDNILFEFEFEFDFMYTSARTDLVASSNINVFRGGNSNAGYDFKTKSFFVGNNGGWMNSSNGPDVIYTSAEYELIPGRWYNLAYNWTAEGVVTMYLDGVEVLTCDLASVGGDHTQYEYAIFYPQNVDLYIGDYSHSSVRWGYTANPLQNAGYGQDAIDVLAPVDVVSKIEAAEEAVAVLTEEQAALLDASYTDALAAAKAEVQPLYAEIVAAAANVEVLIDAIDSTDDITAAAAAYNALTAGAKTLVKNYADLEAANANLVVAEIDALGEITPASADAIAAAEASYNALTEAEKAFVTNYATLTAARKELNAMNAAIGNATNAINMLQANGSVLKNVADNYSTGSYSQILDVAEDISGTDADHAPYTFSLDVLVESVNAQTATITLADEVKDEAGNVVTPEETVDVSVAYIGWASGNDVFVAYDLVNSKFVVADNGPFRDNYAETLAGLNSVYGEAAYDLALNTWYNLEFVVEATYVEILVDGESVLKVDVDVNGYNIFYPVNNTAYYDNYTLTYNGAVEEAVADWAGIDTATWVAHNGNAYSVVAAPSTGAVKTNADLVAAARAAYDAVPEKAQYAVANYGILEEAEASAPVVDPDAEAKAAAAEVDAVIAAIGEVTLDSEAAIVAARAAYDALDDAAKAFVAELAALEAAEAALADLKAAEALKAEAAAVDAAIAAIGEVTLDSEAAIDAAREAYDALSAEAQALVTELAALEAAEAALEDLQKAADKQYIHDVILGKVTPAAPANVVATPAENSINVSWDAVDGAVKYWVYVDGEVVAVTTDTNITVRAAAGEHIIKVQVALTATYGTVYAAGISDEVVATAEPAAPVFEITSAAVVDGEVVVEWTAAEGATKYWVAFDGSAAAYTHRVDSGESFSYSAEKFAGDYSVVVKALVDGKIVETAAVNFTA